MYEIRGITKSLDGEKIITKVIVFDPHRKIYHTLFVPDTMSTDPTGLRVWVGSQLSVDKEDVTIAPYLKTED